MVRRKIFPKNVDKESPITENEKSPKIELQLYYAYLLL
jgi:hypothetical protein